MLYRMQAVYLEICWIKYLQQESYVSTCCCPRSEAVFVISSVQCSVLWRHGVRHVLCMLGYLDVSIMIIRRTLTWTTESLTCICDLLACVCTRGLMFEGVLSGILGKSVLRKKKKKIYIIYKWWMQHGGKCFTNSVYWESWMQHGGKCFTNSVYWESWIAPNMSYDILGH